MTAWLERQGGKVSLSFEHAAVEGIKDTQHWVDMVKESCLKAGRPCVSINMLEETIQ